MMVIEISAGDEDILKAAGMLLPPTTIVAVADDMRRYFYRCPDWNSRRRCCNRA